MRRTTSEASHKNDPHQASSPVYHFDFKLNDTPEASKTGSFFDKVVAGGMENKAMGTDLERNKKVVFEINPSHLVTCPKCRSPSSQGSGGKVGEEEKACVCITPSMTTSSGVDADQAKSLEPQQESVLFLTGSIGSVPSCNTFYTEGPEVEKKEVVEEKAPQKKEMEGECVIEIDNGELDKKYAELGACVKAPPIEMCTGSFNEGDEGRWVGVVGG